MEQDNSKKEPGEAEWASSVQAEADRVAAAARHSVELALLEARVQIARSCGA